MAKGYETVYYGSARGSKGVGRTQGPGVKQDIIAKAGAISSESQKVGQDYERVVQQHSAEMQRQDRGATFVEQKALADLKDLNKSINNFFMTAAKTVGKDYVAEKRSQGIDLVRKYNAGDPDAVAKIDGDEAQLAELEKKIDEQRNKVDEQLGVFDEEGYRLTLQDQLRAQNIRKLGSNVRWGYIRGGLMEAGKNYSGHLQNMLTQSDEIITLKDGTEIRVGDYYETQDAEVRNQIVNYVEDQYIADNNPFGANEKAVRTYLTKSVVGDTDKFQQKEVIRFNREQAVEEEQTLNNELLIAIESDDAVTAASKIQSILTRGNSIKTRQGIQGSSRTATKEWVLKILPEQLGKIKDDGLRERIMDQIDKQEFTIPGLGTKRLEEFWRDDFDKDDILGKADTIWAKQFSDSQTALKLGAQEDIRDLRQKVLSGQVPKEEFTTVLGVIHEKYDNKGLLGIEEIIKNNKNWTPSHMTYETSMNYATEIINTRGFLTEKEAMYIDKKLYKTLKEDNKILDKIIGEGDEATSATKESLVKQLNKYVTQSAHSGADKNFIVPGTTEDTQKIAMRMMMKDAQEILAAGGYQTAEGFVKVGNDGDALRAAFIRTKARVSEGLTNEQSPFFLTADGYRGKDNSITASSINADSPAMSRAKIDLSLEKLRVESQNTNEDLIASNELSFITDEMLTPNVALDGSQTFHPAVEKLFKIDQLEGSGTRDIYEIINLKRSQRNLDLIEVPPAVEAARVARGTTTKDIQKAFALNSTIGDQKGFDRTVDQAGGVNLNMMQNAFVSEDAMRPFFELGVGTDGTNDYSNLARTLERANLPFMTREEFLANPEAQIKLHKFLTNDMMKKAEVLTNDKNEMIRLSAIGMRFGEEAMQNYKNNPDMVTFANNAVTRYYSGAQFPDSVVINPISPEDIIVEEVPADTGDSALVAERAMGISVPTYTPAFTRKQVMTPVQREILSAPLSDDLGTLQEELNTLRTMKEWPEPGTKLHDMLTKRGKLLQSKVRSFEILNDFTGGLSEVERVGGTVSTGNWPWERTKVQGLFHPQYGTVVTMIGTERYNALKDKAYNMSTYKSSLAPEYQTNLIRLLLKEPEFAGITTELDGGN